MSDTREDVLLRPEPTFAPYSVYVDVSPIYPVEFDKHGNGLEICVSDTFRVWELWEDYHNLATAKVNKLAVEALSFYSAVKVYDNSLELFISDHPVFYGK